MESRVAQRFSIYRERIVNGLRTTFRYTALLALLLASSISSSEGQESPKEFYPKDFVQQQAPSPESATRGSTPHSQSAPKYQAKQPAPAVPSSDSAETIPNHSMQEPDFPKGNASERATEVSVFVNSLNAEHLNRVLTKIISLNAKGKIHIGAIMLMGNSQNVAEKTKSALASQGTVMLPITELPSNLPITRSPAWIVTEMGPNDENSAQLVEGYFDIEQFFDQYGHFSIPAGMEVERPREKAPEELEGF
jgi:hypothetical protein